MLLQLKSVDLKALLNKQFSMAVSLPLIERSGSLDLKKYQNEHAIVLYFLNEQCGVTYYYINRIANLQKKFEKKGFKFLGVRVGQKSDATKPPDLPETKRLTFPFVDDINGVLLDRFQIQQSATFALLDKSSRLKFLGAFDDNVTETRAKHHYLEDALLSVLANKPVKTSFMPPIGCAIVPIKSVIKPL